MSDPTAPSGITPAGEGRRARRASRRSSLVDTDTSIPSRLVYDSPASLTTDRDPDVALRDDGGNCSPPVRISETDPRPIRVLIAEDMHMIRGALVALLSLEHDIDVVAELDRGDDIVDAAVVSHPDVAVLDIDLPGLDGVSAAELLHKRVPTCTVLVVTGLPQPGHLLRALKAHIRGFMLKDAPAAELADAVRGVAAGRLVIPPDLLAQALATGESPLTPREAEVLEAAQSGLPTDQLADLLCLSPTTVRNYLSNAITKVGGRNRLQAIRIACHAGWILGGRELALPTDVPAPRATPTLAG